MGFVTYFNFILFCVFILKMKFTLMGCLKAGAVAIGVSYIMWGIDNPGAGEVFVTRGKEGYSEQLKQAVEQSEKLKKGGARGGSGRMGD